MVATSMHYIVGVLLAHLLGVKGSKKYWLGFIAVIPDLDGIILTFLFVSKNIIGYNLGWLEHNQMWVTLLAHRGITHSLLLLGLVILSLWLFKPKHNLLKLVVILWSSHLLLDYLTSWKLFPFLPFSFQPFYFGLVEVFDSVLVLLTTTIFALFIGSSLLKNEKKLPLVVAVLFVLGLGLLPSVFMGEYNTQTIVLSQLILWSAIALYAVKKTNKRWWSSISLRGVRYLALVIVLYLSVLTVNQMMYAITIGTTPANIEPLEEFSFNSNAHTFEIDKGDFYEIGVISWKGIEERKTVPKHQDSYGGLTNSLISEYEHAYRYALHSNWFNHPVFTYFEDSEGTIYANSRYAKSFLDNPHMPGPQQGIDVTLENGLLVGYGPGWFS